jgi:hypothetical protein
MRIPILLFAIAVGVMPAAAQLTSGTLLGIVKDPSERPVARAAVRLVDRLREEQRTAYTDRAGVYRFTGLVPSEYDLFVSADGFAAVTAESVRLSVDSESRVDFVLRLPDVRQSIEVVARVRNVQTDSSDLSAVLDETAIRGLPLNRRDFLQLALLTAGVLPPVQDSELSSRGAFAMHANGAREEFNNFMLDGMDNNDQTANRYVLQPSVDSIQEFKIATNNYAAEYGRSGGAQVNVVTRRGSAQMHGFAYEYVRNRALDARNFFDSTDRAKYIRNQFGGGMGGPAVRNRVYFFGAFEQLRSRQGLSRLATVPGLAERSGDLSGLSANIIDIFAGKPFPDKRIPASRISPIALRVLELFPAPTRAGVSNNFLGQPVAAESTGQYTGRVDYRAGARDNLTVRYSYGSVKLFEPFAEQASNVPGFGDHVADDGQNAVVHHQHSFGPATVNSILIGINRATRHISQQNAAVDVNAVWGVKYFPTLSRDFGYPSMAIAGYSPVGDVTSLPIIRTATTSQFVEGLSIVRGSHALKIGGEVRNVRQTGILDLLTRGSLTFSGAISGAGIADLLLGFPSFALQSKADNIQTQRTTAYGAFLQDDWKVARILTLNIGLRYEFNTPPTDPTDRMAVFDWSTKGLTRVGTGGVSRSGLRPDRNNFAPRIGFALEAGRRTVLRGAYGVFYDSGTLMMNSSAYFNPPYFSMNIFFPSQTSLLTLNDPFPLNRGVTPAASLSSFSPELATAYLQHWNLNLQHELGRVGTISVAYSGSKGTRLIRSRDLNQPPPAAGELAGRRALPRFGNILYAESGANSEYGALEATFRRAMNRNTALLGIYTFSKSLDDTSAFLPTFSDRNFPQDSRNFRAEHGLSSFDMKHRGMLAFVQRIPGEAAWSRDFEAAGIVTAQSGQPFTPVLRFDNSNTGNTGGNFGSDRPNLLRNPVVGKPSPERWFDSAAFAVPARYTFGNAGRNIVRGPGVFTVDLSLSRRFSLAERAFVRLQAQVFNVLNLANFDLPEHYADEPLSFGRILSAKSPRQIQFALRLEF